MGFFSANRGTRAVSDRAGLSGRQPLYVIGPEVRLRRADPSERSGDLRCADLGLTSGDEVGEVGEVASSIGGGSYASRSSFHVGGSIDHAGTALFLPQFVVAPVGEFRVWNSVW